MKISNLPDGCYFKFEGLNPKLWRGCHVLKVSDSSVLIGGFHRESESEPWKPISKGYYISCGTEVTPCSMLEAGVDEIALEIKEKKEKNSKLYQTKRNGLKFVLELPKPGVEFSLKDLAKKHNKHPSYIYPYFKKICHLCRETRKVENARGRATQYYVVNK